MRPLRVALVHDWLTGFRGGEKVLEELATLYPEAELYTLVHVPGSTSARIEDRRIHASPLNHLPGVTRHYRNGSSKDLPPENRTRKEVERCQAERAPGPVVIRGQGGEVLFEGEAGSDGKVVVEVGRTDYIRLGPSFEVRLAKRSVERGREHLVELHAVLEKQQP